MSEALQMELTRDPLQLAQALIQCASVTPAEGGALDLLQEVLQGLGFRCHRLPFSQAGTPDVDNLYARFGRGQPNFCFAGHTDVVPVGDAAAWTGDPFAGELRDGKLFGRGATDMKGAIAAFAAAAERFLAERLLAEGGDGFEGSISLLITGDEEGPAINGTVKVLQWLKENGEHLDHCLVGEPTNPNELGEMIKHGRRGSITGYLTVKGQQGHVAYPHLADNPVPRLLQTLQALNQRVLDTGNAVFQASNLEITSIDIGNSATNVIPAQAKAIFNTRFNTDHTGAELKNWFEATCAKHAGAHEIRVDIGSEPFLTEPGPFTDILQAAVTQVTGRRAELSTTGGTSDARFIKNHCPVAEFGLIGQTMHQVDEHVSIDDITQLAEIYHAVLQLYFAATPITGAP